MDERRSKENSRIKSEKENEKGGQEERQKKKSLKRRKIAVEQFLKKEKKPQQNPAEVSCPKYYSSVSLCDFIYKWCIEDKQYCCAD